MDTESRKQKEERDRKRTLENVLFPWERDGFISLSRTTKVNERMGYVIRRPRFWAWTTTIRRIDV